MVKTVDFGGLSATDLKSRQGTLDRKKALIDALRGSATTPLQQQQVSGQVVEISPWQGLAKLGEAFLTRRSEKKASEEQTALSSETSKRAADALKALAPEGVFPQAENYTGPMARAGNTPAPAVADPVRQKWIQALKASEVNPELGQKMVEGLLVPNQQPSNVQEWEYFSKLSPEQQEQYLTMRRGTPAINLGDRQVIPSQTNPGTARAQFEVGLPPQDTPEVRGRQAAAVEAAQTAAIPGRVSAQAQAELTAAPVVGEAARQQALAETAGQRAGAVATKEDQFKLLDEVINEVKGQAGAMTTGFMGAATAGIPGMPASDMASNLDTLQAAAGFEKLQEMRNNSPTGGALGSVTERELALLQATWGSLQQRQSREQFLRNLERFQNQVKDSWRRVEEAYRRDYGTPMYAAAPTQQTAPRRRVYNPATGEFE